MEPSEFCQVEAEIAPYEGYCHWQDCISEDFLHPNWNQEAYADTQDGSSDGHPHEVSHHSQHCCPLSLHQTHEEHEEDHCCAIVEQGLALDQKIELYACAQLFEKSHHCHGVGCWEDTAQGAGLVPGEVIVIIA